MVSDYILGNFAIIINLSHCFSDFRNMLLYLLSPEVVSYEVLLQFFVGIVDAQLLQVVDAKALKAVHVENP